MTADEYWHGSPELTQAYRAAYKVRKEERNWELWLQGLYIYHAICVALSHILDKNSKEEYMSEPLDIFPPTEEEIKERQEKEAEELVRRLNAFAEVVNGREQHTARTEYNGKGHKEKP